MENCLQTDHLAENRYQHILSRQPAFPWLVFSDGEELKCRVFFPEGHSGASSSPSVIFFHGGMWSSPSDTEFVPWALHLKTMGIVSVIPEFRTKSGYDVQGRQILSDARELWEWVNGNAAELGIDPDRIAVAGSDLGGLMALHVALPDVARKHRWFRKDAPLPHGPAAVALFRGVTHVDVPELARLQGSFSQEELKAVNPASRVQRGLPALFVSHGGKDKLLPPRYAHEFCRLWKKHRNPADFQLLDVADHSFYHFNVNALYFEHILAEWSRFMAERGIWDVQDASDASLLLL